MQHHYVNFPDNFFPVEKEIDRRFPAAKVHVERNPITIRGREFPWEFSRADVGQIAMSNPDEIAFIGIYIGMHWMMYSTIFISFSLFAIVLNLSLILDINRS